MVPGRARRPRPPATATSTSGPTRPTDGGPPNNWLSNFGGSAWTLHEPSGQYYLNQFLPTQPDLNWWNEELREAIDDVLAFWFDRGVAGFRIDVCHAIVKDRELRDDPLPEPDDHPHVVKRGLKQVYSMNRPELHDVLRRWRALDGRRATATSRCSWGRPTCSTSSS